MAVVYSAPDSFLELMGDGSIDMDGDTFKIALLNGYTFDSGHNNWANVSSTELGTANGYTSPGQNLSSVTWGQTGGTVVFDAANVSWTASGGSIGPATDAEIYSDTSTDDKLVCNIDFGASETAGDGSNFQINFNASGIFTGAFS